MIKYCRSNIKTNLSINPTTREISNKFQSKQINYFFPNINSAIYDKINNVFNYKSERGTFIITEDIIPVILLNFNKSVMYTHNRCRDFKILKNKGLYCNILSDIVENGVLNVNNLNYENKPELQNWLFKIGIIDDKNNVKSHYLMDSLFSQHRFYISEAVSKIQFKILNSSISLPKYILRKNNTIIMDKLYAKLDLDSSNDKNAIRYFLLDFEYIKYYNGYYHITEDFNLLFDDKTISENKQIVISIPQTIEPQFNIEQCIDTKLKNEDKMKQELKNEIKQELINEMNNRFIEMQNRFIKAINEQAQRLISNYKEIDLEHESNESESEIESNESEINESENLNEPITLKDMIDDMDTEHIDLTQQSNENQKLCIIC